ncbi:MAG: NAD(P)H-hydrate dehydratase [Gammaproteobacteria bacterium]|nr:MAG: NAD(P)H-hydrate dehydratase [Gammaproteobacteria bacterium]
MFLYSPEKVYQLDQAAVKVDGFTEVELMQRAGLSVWRALCLRWPAIEKITVFAGSGNNGGDAFVVALCAREQGVEVQLLVQGDLSRQSGTSRHFAQLWQQAGGSYEDWQGQSISGDIIVDGLLGIGLQRELNDEWQQLIEVINHQPVPRVAIDIPSGLNGLTGNPQPVAVEADLCVTFIGAKTGQYLADGPDYCGELIFEDLGVSSAARAGIETRLEVIRSCQLPPTRKKNTHKNHYGNLLIIGGDQGMSGAVTLAARAALRSGAGLVTALVHPECRTNLAAFPEIMVLAWDALAAKLPQASVVVIGPGLGDSAAAGKILEDLQQVDLPVVVDASALKADFLESMESAQLLITPHPGEAAALLSSSSAEIQADRLAASDSLAQRFGATCVLKGSGTLIAESGRLSAINVHGHAGMASAGMGDVLSGIVAALIGQGLSLFEAARSAVLIHALCAEDFSAEQDQSGLIAGDIIERIPRVIRQLRDQG